jgi:hypothetical protein
VTLFHHDITHLLPLLAVGLVMQSCGWLPWREPSLAPSGRTSNATITIRFDGQLAILRHARLSLLTLANGSPSWILNAFGPDNRGIVEITCLESAIAKDTDYVLDDTPASESAFLVVRTKRGLQAYSLDASRTSTVFIESVARGRVTGRFTLNLVRQTAKKGEPHTELVCEHFDVPLVSDRESW